MSLHNTLLLVPTTPFSAYQGMIGASLTIQNDHIPVQSLSDVVKFNYKVVATKGTSVEKYFLESKRGSPPHQIMKDNRLIAEQTSSQPIIKSMLDGSLANDILFVGVYQPLQYSSGWSCRMTSVKADYRKIGNGMIFQKNWPFTNIFNQQLIRLKEEGYLDALQRRYNQMHRSKCYGISISPISMTDTMSLYVMMAIGMLLSAIVLLMEKLLMYFKIKTQPSPKNAHNLHEMC